MARAEALPCSTNFALSLGLPSFFLPLSRLSVSFLPFLPKNMPDAQTFFERDEIFFTRREIFAGSRPSPVPSPPGPREGGLPNLARGPPGKGKKHSKSASYGWPGWPCRAGQATPTPSGPGGCSAPGRAPPAGSRGAARPFSPLGARRSGSPPNLARGRLAGLPTFMPGGLRGETSPGAEPRGLGGTGCGRASGARAFGVAGKGMGLRNCEGREKNLPERENYEEIL